MQGQEFLIQAIQDLIPDVETPDSIKHLSRTDLRQITKFPAVLVTEEPYDFSQDTGRSDILLKREKCNLVIIVRSVNINDLTENLYKGVKDKLDLVTDEVLTAVLEKVPNYNKVSNLAFGTGEVFDGLISAIPVMWNLIPVTVTLVN